MSTGCSTVLSPTVFTASQVPLPCPQSLCSFPTQYGIVLDAGSSHTAMYIYKWPADKQNGTGIVTQHGECHAEGEREQPRLSTPTTSPLPDKITDD